MITTGSGCTCATQLDRCGRARRRCPACAIIDAGDGNDFIELGSLEATGSSRRRQRRRGRRHDHQGVKSSDCGSDFGSYELPTAGTGNDRLTGGAFDDFIAGDGDDDRIEGWRGDDELDGGSGRDVVDCTIDAQRRALIDLATSAPINGPDDEGDILRGFEAAIGVRRG